MREVTAEDVRLQLLERIASGDLQPGMRLGTERDLAAGFGVSRTLLRQALESLERDGAIRRVRGPGGGTFVSQGEGRADSVDDRWCPGCSGSRESRSELS